MDDSDLKKNTRETRQRLFYKNIPYHNKKKCKFLLFRISYILVTMASTTAGSPRSLSEDNICPIQFRTHYLKSQPGILKLIGMVSNTISYQFQLI
jgi:hypothetical protein